MHWCALIWACTFCLSTSGAPRNALESDRPWTGSAVSSPPVATLRSSSVEYLLDDNGESDPTTNAIEKTAGAPSPPLPDTLIEFVEEGPGFIQTGNPGHPALLTRDNSDRHDHLNPGPVSTSTRRFSRAADHSTIPWSTLIGAEVVIQARSGKFLSTQHRLKWSASNRQLANTTLLFHCSEILGPQEKLFLHRTASRPVVDTCSKQTKGATEVLFRNGVVLYSSSGSLLEDDVHMPILHFEPNAGGYQIYRRARGAPFGPPARCDGDKEEEAIFNVVPISHPESIAGWEIIEHRQTPMTLDFTYATLHCNPGTRSVEYVKPYGDQYWIWLFGELTANVSLQFPLPGFPNDTEGGTLSLQDGAWSKVFESPLPWPAVVESRTPTSVMVRKRVMSLSFTWCGRMTYTNSSATRMVVGGSKYMRVEEVESVDVFPGNPLYRGERCVPFNDTLSVEGTFDNGTRVKMYDRNAY